MYCSPYFPALVQSFNLFQGLAWSYEVMALTKWLEIWGDIWQLSEFSGVGRLRFLCFPWRSDPIIGCILICTDCIPIFLDLESSDILSAGHSFVSPWWCVCVCVGVCVCVCFRCPKKSHEFPWISISSIVNPICWQSNLFVGKFMDQLSLKCGDLWQFMVICGNLTVCYWKLPRRNSELSH